MPKTAVFAQGKKLGDIVYTVVKESLEYENNEKPQKVMTEKEYQKKQEDAVQV